MSPDEVRAKLARAKAAHEADRPQELADLFAAVLEDIATMPAEYPGDAIIMRALARAAIGADDDAV